MELLERLNAVVSYSKLSQRAFALKCGLKQPTLDKQLKGLRSVSADTIIAICKMYPEISREWFLLGEGDMLKTQNDQEIEGITKSDAIDILSLSTHRATTTIVERLQEIVKYSNLSVRALAMKCSLKQQTLNKHTKGFAEPSANTLMAILNTFPEISADWLLLGVGTMLRSDKESERITCLVGAISTLQETIAILNNRIRQLESQLNSK